ncbi:MAG: GGDEF domain-containing protein [Thiobacillus sp. 63-78]|uniref:diguanylate cyclase domain-containing protein n=1 Tax=Thiobacillus sp. 63-78 TaxID=1895859 RepID=UPI0009688A98|nr:diguanylate cyclase [Thiobacillus sp. 63-78]MBN8774984.1 diguanylate cyclase [Thiobacillus sp.]OJZ08201.1 MAG: GGDEF domain-containing protein [Thiobacillus sp. 63-78]
MLFPLIDELATTDIVSVPPRVAVRDALRKMSQYKVRNVIVEEESGGYGLLTASDVVRLRFSQPGLDATISEAGYHPLPYIAKGSNLLDVIELFNDTHGYAAVIDESNRLFGIVSNTDILASLDPQSMLQRQHLRDLLRRHEVKRMPHDTPLGEVLASLVAQDDAVVVTDQDTGVGIVTTRDAIRLLQDGAVLADPVHVHMSVPLRTVTCDLTVGEAVAVMRDLNFKRLVVEDPQSRELIGIITQQDLIGVAYSRWAELMHHHALELREIIHVLEHKTARLEKIAATDPLTGMANRARFEELLRTEQERHCRLPMVPFSVLIADIDRFKHINDTWGHNQGDIVLRGVAQHIQGQLRHIDTLARWGGEEFAVLLPQTDLEAARLVAGRICRSLAQNVFERVGCVTASFGAAMYQTGESAAALLGRADEALYRAKRNGRNRIE